MTATPSAAPAPSLSTDALDDAPPPADDKVLRTQTDRRQLQQIITGLTEGVILVEPDQTIVWANQAALQMHGITEVAQLGRKPMRVSGIATLLRSVTMRSRAP
jgi:PAS domain-containing protein